MCLGRITKVWFQKEPITAFKVTQIYDWSVELSNFTPGVWYHAIPRIIISGGGNGVEIKEAGDNYGSANVASDETKSVGVFLSNKATSLAEIDDVQLTGWHAYRFLVEAKKFMEDMYWQTVYEVELRGLLQESGTGEFMASEMRVLEQKL